MRHILIRHLFWAVSLVVVNCSLLPSIACTALPQGQKEGWDVKKPRGQTREIDFTTDEGTWMSVDISPDGDWVVFDLLGHIYRVAVLGGHAECLTQDSGIAMNYHPRYSPDGKQIAFVSDRAGQDNLWLMNADGSNPHPVFLDESSRVVEPAWTPDGRFIVATRRMRTELGFYRTNDRIWMFPREGGPGKLVAGSAKPSRLRGEFEGDTRYQWPSVSPDGRYIYYNVSNFSGGDRHIQRVDLKTKQIDDVTEEKHRYLTHNARPASPLPLGEAAPEVSPDGRWLAFARKIPGGRTSFRGKEYVGRTALWLKNLETGRENIIMDPISNDQMNGHPPWSNRVLPGYSWSKDSKYIVISQGGKIRRLTVETGEVKTLVFQAHVHRTICEMARASINIEDDSFEVRSIRWPASSPNGRQLVFEAVGQLWILDLPNGKPRPLTTEKPAGIELTPTWSPNGKWIAYATASGDRGGDVFKINLKDGTIVQVTREPATYLWPFWSPDGQSVLVNRWPKVLNRDLANPQWELVLIPAGGGSAVLIKKIGVLTKNGFGFGGRILYETRHADRSVVLKSMNRTGRDDREHLTIGPFVDEVIPSPDDHWLAVHWREDVYIVRSAAPTTDKNVKISLNREPSGLKRLSYEGGYYPRWRNAATLEFVSGNQYFAYHTDSGRMDKIEISLRVRRQVPNETIALTGARIITLNGGQIIQNGSILVKGSRISCVGQCDTARAERVVDLSGKTIIPGLIDVHAHLLEEETDGIIALQRRASGVYLAYGVTTVRDPFSPNEPSFTIGEMVEAGRITGPRTYSAGQALICMNEGEYEIAQRPIRSVKDAREHVDRQANWGAVVIKDYKLCTRTQRQMLAEAVRNKGLSLTSEGGDLFYDIGLIMDGYTGWEHSLQHVPIYGDVSTFLGLAHAHHTPNHLIAGLPQELTLEYFYGNNDLWGDRKVALWSRWQETAARRIFIRKPIDEYTFPIQAEGSADIKRAGGHIGIGDHGEWKGLGTNWEIWANAVAMTPIEALEAASLDGAHFLGLEKHLGSIEVGKLADLVILNANPLDDIRNTVAIWYVMKAGTLYDGETLDELWPQERPYGLRPWLFQDVLRLDVRKDDYWDKHQ